MSALGEAAGRIVRDRRIKSSAKEGQREDILEASAERGASGCAMPRTCQPYGGKFRESGLRPAAAALATEGSSVPCPPEASLRHEPAPIGRGRLFLTRWLPGQTARPLRRPSPGRPRPAQWPTHSPCHQRTEPCSGALPRPGRNGLPRAAPRDQGYGLATAPVSRPPRSRARPSPLMTAPLKVDIQELLQHRRADGPTVDIRCEHLLRFCPSEPRLAIRQQG